MPGNSNAGPPTRPMLQNRQSLACLFFFNMMVFLAVFFWRRADGKKALQGAGLPMGVRIVT